MARNGRLYISHTAQDDAQVEPFLNVLDAKTVDVWYESAPAGMTGALTPEIAREIEQRDVFVRVLSALTAQSPRMTLELAEFERLRQMDAQAGNSQRRTRINIIVDPTYERQPGDTGMTINLTTMPESAWLPLTRRRSWQTPDQFGTVDLDTLGGGPCLRVYRRSDLDPGDFLPRVFNPSLTAHPPYTAGGRTV